MNMRQHKRMVMVRQIVPWMRVRIRRGCCPRMPLDLAALVETLPDIAPEFQCVKVNGGEVVDTFQTRSEALALVLKHAKQRKAKLQVVDTSTGEIQVFSEKEMA